MGFGLVARGIYLGSSLQVQESKIYLFVSVPLANSNLWTREVFLAFLLFFILFQVYEHKKLSSGELYFPPWVSRIITHAL